jgi:hypothetical protein
VTASVLASGHPVHHVGVIAAYMASRSPVVVLATMIILVLYRLLAERGRRKTLVCLLDRAPSGTILNMKDGQDGAAMSLQVGDRPVPEPPGDLG